MPDDSAASFNFRQLTIYAGHFAIHLKDPDNPAKRCGRSFFILPSHLHCQVVAKKKRRSRSATAMTRAEHRRRVEVHLSGSRRDYGAVLTPFPLSGFAVTVGCRNIVQDLGMIII